jgi:hypothetical protein
LRVTWTREGIEHLGWWRVDERSVVAVVTDPPTDPPVHL